MYPAPFIGNRLVSYSPACLRVPETLLENGIIRHYTGVSKDASDVAAVTHSVMRQKTKYRKRSIGDEDGN